jgi:hypothetical protein
MVSVKRPTAFLSEEKFMRRMSGPMQRPASRLPTWIQLYEVCENEHLEEDTKANTNWKTWTPRGRCPLIGQISMSANRTNPGRLHYLRPTSSSIAALDSFGCCLGGVDPKSCAYFFNFYFFLVLYFLSYFILFYFLFLYFFILLFSFYIFIYFLSLRQNDASESQVHGVILCR